MKPKLNRRELLGKAAASVAAAPLIQTALTCSATAAPAATLNGLAGVDRVTILPGKTYLRGWAGYGDPPPPAKQLDAVYTKNFKINSPLWNARAKSLMVSWIPHCIDQINRTDLTQGPGGIDNFVEAGKALRGEPHGAHKGYVFSNAWVHQTVEAMSIALMIDPQGDREIIEAHEKMRATLEDWIPKILAAQEPDGYLQTAFTLPRVTPNGTIPSNTFKHWDPAHRTDHEGYVA